MEKIHTHVCIMHPHLRYLMSWAIRYPVILDCWLHYCPWNQVLLAPTDVVEFSIFVSSWLFHKVQFLLVRFHDKRGISKSILILNLIWHYYNWFLCMFSVVFLTCGIQFHFFINYFYFFPTWIGANVTTVRCMQSIQLVVSKSVETKTGE